MFDRASNRTIVWSKFTAAECAQDRYILLPLAQLKQDMRMLAELLDPEGLEAFSTELQACMAGADRAPGLEFHALDLHINDNAFCEAALQVFDRWVAEGKVVAGGAPA